MHITTEQKEHCILDLHLELPPERFEKEYQRIAGEYARLARLPGFRKGKAPLSAIKKKYGKEIEGEALEKTIEEALREIIAEKKFDLIQYPELRDKKLQSDHRVDCTVTLMLRPQIDLPDYHGISLTLEKEALTEERVEELLEKMRHDFSEFVNIEERGLEFGDFAILNYEATLDGKPLAQALDELPTSFLGGKNRWLKIEELGSIPFLGEKLLGLKPQESRTCSIIFPADFEEQKLAGSTVNYEVFLHEIKKQQLAPLDNALASRIKPGATLEELRQEIREQLLSFIEQQFQNTLRSKLIEELLHLTPLEVPSPLLQRESHLLLEKIIQENRSRGVSEEEIKSHEEELLQSARKNADEKVRLRFILHAIAAKEKIVVTAQELNDYLTLLAEHYKMTFKKLLTELKKHHALGGIEEELLCKKTLQFLISKAQVTSVPVAKQRNHAHTHGEQHHHGPNCNHEES